VSKAKAKATAFSNEKRKKKEPSAVTGIEISNVSIICNFLSMTVKSQQQSP
jgi:hypothetical protein